MNTRTTTSATLLLAVLLMESTQVSLSQTPPANMSLIPPGTFVMGDTFSEGGRDELPLHTVYVSAFYMDKYEVTKALWDNVYQWATNHGYSFYGSQGLGKAINHPTHSMRWYEALKWCNARSEKENKTPAYYTDASLTALYRSAQVIPFVNWNAGYRLPTEAEWEKAARGGTSGHRFPWSDANIITHSRANYYSSSTYFYDISPTRGYHPTFNDGVTPYTNPVGYFAPNGYGLYGMSGNVWEWCWDWDSDTYYSSSPTTDPHGPETGSYRVIRGGILLLPALYCRVSSRSHYHPSSGSEYLGFRTVLPYTLPEWCSAFPPQPTYSDCPQKLPGKDSLIVVTHGWINKTLHPFSPPDPTWVDSMTNAISQRLLGNWQVAEYKWIAKSWTIHADDALNNAKQEGLKLGNCISTQGWNNVHLIGHSAGAGLIQAVTEVIKTNSSSTVVHSTFLDAFVGTDYAGITNFGKDATWSDSYFSYDVETGSYTSGSLSNTYNVDVTLLDTHKIPVSAYWSSIDGALESCNITESSHGWPIDFYINSITRSVTSDYENFGFPLSIEGGFFSVARTTYYTGNSVSQILGILDPACSQLSYVRALASVSTRVDKLIDYIVVPSIQSTTGLIQKFINASIHLFSGSPVWIVAIVGSTNAVNFVSFDAKFTSTNGSLGLLSVYWDDDKIGSLDEQAIMLGFQHYVFRFPNSVSNSSHVLGFRLDSFTNIQSSVLITNITTGQIGPSQPFSLIITTNIINGLPVYQLVGQSGFEYNVLASSNLFDWICIATLVNTNGTVKFIDAKAPNSTQRFYRAIGP